MAFHFLSKTPPSQLWLRHWFSKANNSLACIWDQLDGCVSWDEWEVWAGTWEVGSGRMGPAHEARQPHKILLPVTTDVPLALTLQVQQVQRPIASLTEPNVIAVPQCGSCCAPRAVLFLLSARGNCIAHAAQILTPSQMPHAIISEKFRELTSAPSFYHLPPSYSLTCFSGSKKTLIFTLLVSNKTGTNGSWQNTFSVSLKTYRPDVLEMHSVTNACLARTHLLHLSDGAEQPEQKR